MHVKYIRVILECPNCGVRRSFIDYYRRTGREVYQVAVFRCLFCDAKLRKEIEEYATQEK